MSSYEGRSSSDSESGTHLAPLIVLEIATGDVTLQLPLKIGNFPKTLAQMLK